MALATDSGMAIVCTAVRVLPVVIAAKLRVMEVPSVAIGALSLLSAAYMLWLFGVYPIWQLLR